MTARPEFGDAIAVEGARPAWLPGDVRFHYQTFSGWFPGGSHLTTVWAMIRAIRLEVPRYDFVYLALSKNLTPYFGQGKPDDWDGGAVLLLLGDMCAPDGLAYHDSLWRHDGRHDDIIGYTRKAASTALPLAQGVKLGWDADGMCDDHYRFACKECALPLAHPAAPQGENILEQLRVALTLRDNRTGECPDSQLDPGKDCPRCGANSNEGCRITVLADATFVANVRAALAPAAIASGREGEGADTSRNCQCPQEPSCLTDLANCPIHGDSA